MPQRATGIHKPRHRARIVEFAQSGIIQPLQTADLDKLGSPLCPADELTVHKRVGQKVHGSGIVGQTVLARQNGDGVEQHRWRSKVHSGGSGGRGKLRQSGHAELLGGKRVARVTWGMVPGGPPL